MDKNKNMSDIQRCLYYISVDNKTKNIARDRRLITISFYTV